MQKYKGFVMNVLILLLSILLLWGGSFFIRLFLGRPSRDYNQLKELYASTRNKIVDVRSRANGRNREIRKEIKGVSEDVLKDDTKSIEMFLKKYLNVDSSADYLKLKESLIKDFGADSSFVKTFYSEETFKDTYHFESVSVYPQSWSDDGSVRYNIVVSYSVGKDKRMRYGEVTSYYSTDEKIDRKLKDFNMIDVDFSG